MEIAYTDDHTNVLAFHSNGAKLNNFRVLIL